MKFPPMEEIKKLAKEEDTQLQRELRRIERTKERFEKKMERKEEKIREAHKLKGLEIEKRIQEIAKENGMLCYIGHNPDTDPLGKEIASFMEKIRNMGAISFKRPSGERGRITIFPSGSKEEPRPGGSKPEHITAPNGYWINKSLLAVT